MGRQGNTTLVVLRCSKFTQTMKTTSSDTSRPPDIALSNVRHGHETTDGRQNPSSDKHPVRSEKAFEWSDGATKLLGTKLLLDAFLVLR